MRGNNLLLAVFLRRVPDRAVRPRSVADRAARRRPRERSSFPFFEAATGVAGPWSSPVFAPACRRGRNVVIMKAGTSSPKPCTASSRCPRGSCCSRRSCCLRGSRGRTRLAGGSGAALAGAHVAAAGSRCRLFPRLCAAVPAGARCAQGAAPASAARASAPPARGACASAPPGRVPAAGCRPRPNRRDRAPPRRCAGSGGDQLLDRLHRQRSSGVAMVKARPSAPRGRSGRCGGRSPRHGCGTSKLNTWLQAADVEAARRNIAAHQQPRFRPP